MTLMQYIKCPMCENGKLEQLKEEFYHLEVMDGNIIYLCTKNKTHRFWSHPFNWHNIYYDPNVEHAHGKKLQHYCFEDLIVTTRE